MLYIVCFPTINRARLALRPVIATVVAAIVAIAVVAAALYPSRVPGKVVLIVTTLLEAQEVSAYPRSLGVVVGVNTEERLVESVLSMAIEDKQVSEWLEHVVLATIPTFSGVPHGTQQVRYHLRMITKSNSDTIHVGRNEVIPC